MKTTARSRFRQIMSILCFAMATGCFALFAPGATALARLGETANQCMARYGQPVSADAANCRLDFKAKGMHIICLFDAPEPTAKCIQISYQGMETLDVVKGLVEANSQGSSFGEPARMESSIGEKLVWQRKDAGQAEYYLQHGQLFIRSAELVKAQNQAKQDSTKAKLDGL